MSVSHVTINNWLRKLLKRPIKAKKTFFLRQKDKNRRLEFLDMIKEKNLSGKDIFFTDETQIKCEYAKNMHITLSTKNTEKLQKGFHKF